MALAARQLGDRPLGQRRRVGRREGARDRRRGPPPSRAATARGAAAGPAPPPRAPTAARRPARPAAAAPRAARSAGATARPAASPPASRAPTTARASPSSRRSSVDLPAPFGPAQRDQLARADREADVAKHRRARDSRRSRPRGLDAGSWARDLHAPPDQQSQEHRRADRRRDDADRRSAGQRPRHDVGDAPGTRRRPKNDSGTSARCGAPTASRRMCGTSSPTKPIGPAIATAAPTTSALARTSAQPHARHVDADRLRAHLAQQERVQVARVRRDHRRRRPGSRARPAAGDPRCAPRGRRATSTSPRARRRSWRAKSTG